MKRKAGGVSCWRKGGNYRCQFAGRKQAKFLRKEVSPDRHVIKPFLKLTA